MTLPANPSNKENPKSVHSKTVLLVTYANIVLYALSYQLQTPVEPYLIQKLSEEGQDINSTYGNLMSFFQTIQMIGSPLVGVLLDRIGIRYTSTLVFLASALCYAILSVATDLPTLFWSKVPTVFQAAFLVAQATAATTTGNDAAARAAALGRMTTAYTIGATLGPTLGGYLADQGDFYIGAKLAVVGSLISVGLSLVFLPDETQQTSVAAAAKGSLLDQLKHQVSIAFRAHLWPLLMVKVLGGVVASIHSTAMPLVLTQQLKLEPSQLGMSISASMLAVAAFGALGMAPLTNVLGPPRMTYFGLLGRAMLGCLMATVVTLGTGHDRILVPMVAVAILHALSSHTLATGLTTQTTGAVAAQEQGSLLGLEHSLFSMARIGGPKLATMLLSTGNGGLWPVEIACGIFDVLLVSSLILTATQIASKTKSTRVAVTASNKSIAASKAKISRFKKVPIGGIKLALIFGFLPLCQAADFFPRLLSVTTTRDIATQHSAHWDIQHKGSKRIRDVDEESVELRVILHSEDDLARIEQLQGDGVLSYQIIGKEDERSLESIPDSYSCYRSVVETYETLEQLEVMYPDLVTVSNIGESYFKQQNPSQGYEIKVIVLGVKNSSVVEKSDIMIVAGHHPRELPPPETVTRWAEHLLDNYGKDADITWVLERTRIHIVPVANPDGRQIVQDNFYWDYRKNGRPNSCDEGPEEYGVDLNRNYPMFYGYNSGSSGDPCDSDYRGTGPLSEPETSAVFAYQAALFDDSMKKGTADEARAREDEACPTTARGIFIDVHSAGDFIYFPWGFRDEASPNHLSLLTMSAKLAHPGDYALWGPEQDGFLYFVSGDATDATYGIGCVASYGYEIGSDRNAPCSELEAEIVPIMEASLLYAAKCASAPYLLPLGPDILSIDVDSTDASNVLLQVQVSDDALIVDHANYDSSPGQPIASVRVFVDDYPDGMGSEGILMEAMDGSFDTIDESAVLTLDLSLLEGRHMLYFQATDVLGYAGPTSAVFVEFPEKEEIELPTNVPTRAPTKAPSTEAPIGSINATFNPTFGASVNATFNATVNVTQGNSSAVVADDLEDSYSETTFTVTIESAVTNRNIDDSEIEADENVDQASPWENGVSAATGSSVGIAACFSVLALVCLCF